MKNEDKQALRAFYQTIAGTSGITQQQFDFYLQVLKGDAASRKKWLAENAALLDLPFNLRLVIENMGTLNKNDLAIIAGTQIGAMLAPKAQGFLMWLWSKIKFW